MSEKLRNIVNQIKKEAQFAQLGKPKAQGTSAAKDYGGAEGIFGETPSAKSNKSSSNSDTKNTNVSNPKGNSNVANMQKAIQELAQAVIRDSISSTMGNKPKDVSFEEAVDPVKKSKKSFNDFVAEQYIGPLDNKFKGVEWTSSQQVNTLNDKNKTQTDIYELDAVMNTLKRIGNEKTEFVSDGNWGFRTDNALRNILGFAYALLQLEGDFGLNNNIYTAGNWEHFRQLLSGYKIDGNKVLLSNEEKSQKALEIIKHLEAITNLYDQFRKQVLSKPEFRPFIEGNRNFDKYNGTNQSFSPEEIAVANSNERITGITYIAPKLPTKKLDYIPLKALTNRQEYLKWMIDYAGLDEALAIKVFNNVIKPKIEAL